MHFAAENGSASVVSLLLADPRVEVQALTKVRTSILLFVDSCSLSCSWFLQRYRSPVRTFYLSRYHPSRVI